MEYMWFKEKEKTQVKIFLYNLRDPELSSHLLRLFIPGFMNDSTIKWVHHWSIKEPATRHGDVIICPSGWSVS